jgi:hypothetical protein
MRNFRGIVVAAQRRQERAQDMTVAIESSATSTHETCLNRWSVVR